MTQWDKTSCVPNQELLPDWALSQIGDWAQQYNHKGAMVEVGMGFDLWFLPKDMVLGMLEGLRAKGLRVLTTHVSQNAFQGEFDCTIRCINATSRMIAPLTLHL